MSVIISAIGAQRTCRKSFGHRLPVRVVAPAARGQLEIGLRALRVAIHAHALASIASITHSKTVGSNSATMRASVAPAGPSSATAARVYWIEWRGKGGRHAYCDCT